MHPQPYDIGTQNARSSEFFRDAQLLEDGATTCEDVHGEDDSLVCQRPKGHVGKHRCVRARTESSWT